MSFEGPQRSQIDFEQWASNPRIRFDVRTEDPAESAHRRQVELDEAQHRRRMFWWVFSALIIAGGIALVAMGVSDDADTRDWARNLFAVIVGVVAGFAGGVKAQK